MRCFVREKEEWHLEPIYSDNHLLVLEKPAGIATQPEFHEEARAFVKRTLGKPGNVFLEPLHRLDKPVSGLLLFARTSKALSRLNEAMRGRKLKKFYLALVEGEVPASGVLEHRLVHGNFKAHVDPSGKVAKLQYTRIERRGSESLVEVELLTGRYHQIRCQFAAISHPIVGDKKYGSRVQKKRICLHHHTLIFPHPTKGEMVTCRSRDDAPFG